MAGLILKSKDLPHNKLKEKEAGVQLFSFPVQALDKYFPLAGNQYSAVTSLQSKTPSKIGHFQ